jgi:hypothetical protein
MTRLQIDLLTATIKDLQVRLQRGEITSVQLVRTYLVRPDLVCVKQLQMLNCASATVGSRQGEQRDGVTASSGAR